MLFTKRDVNARAKEVFYATKDYQERLWDTGDFYETLKTMGGEIFDETKLEDNPEMAFMNECLPKEYEANDKDARLARYCLGVAAQQLCNEKKESLKEVFNTDYFDRRADMIARVEKDEDKEVLCEEAFRNVYDYAVREGETDNDVLWDWYSEELGSCEHDDYDILDDEEWGTGRAYSYAKCRYCGATGFQVVEETEDGKDGWIEWQ